MYINIQPATPNTLGQQNTNENGCGNGFTFPVCGCLCTPVVLPEGPEFEGLCERLREHGSGG